MEGGGDGQEFSRESGQKQEIGREDKYCASSLLDFKITPHMFDLFFSHSNMSTAYPVEGFDPYIGDWDMGSGLL